MNIDWGLIQVQYEIFGESVENLAQEFDTTPRMIEYAAETKGWERKALAKAVRDWTQFDMEEISDDILDEVNNRLSILQTLKTSTLNPRYIALETAILGKALDVVKNLDSAHITAATSLSTLAGVLKSLKEQNGTLSDGSEKSGSLKVNILNRVDTVDQTSTQACQVVIHDVA